jgi:hypothetical protein
MSAMVNYFLLPHAKLDGEENIVILNATVKQSKLRSKLIVKSVERKPTQHAIICYGIGRNSVPRSVNIKVK